MTVEHSLQKASVVRRQLLERLIACWQDQKFSFVLLENLFVKNSDPLLLQTLVLTLFCPEEEEDAESSGRIPGRQLHKIIWAIFGAIFYPGSTAFESNFQSY